MKIVINSSFGGFGLSHKAFLRLRELKEDTAINEPDYGEFYKDGSGPRKRFIDSFCRDIPRTSKLLIQVIEELGDKANCKFSNLKIIEIPDNIEFEIKEYDGYEHIAEKHRIWE